MGPRCARMVTASCPASGASGCISGTSLGTSGLCRVRMLLCMELCPRRNRRRRDGYVGFVCGAYDVRMMCVMVADGGVLLVCL